MKYNWYCDMVDMDNVPVCCFFKSENDEERYIPIGAVGIFEEQPA